MHSLSWIKALLAIVVSLAMGSAIASVYTTYLPTVDTKQLSIIISIALILGLISLQQRKI